MFTDDINKHIFQEMETTIRVAGIVPESVVDGPGIRYTLFVQGCINNCEGCHNPETHDLTSGTTMSINDIYEDIKKYKLVKNITFSGGEPFLQYKPLTSLAQVLKSEGYNIASYSGFIFEDIIKHNQLYHMLEYIDLLIDGQFIIDQRTLDLKYRGSKNQRIIDVPNSLKTEKTVLITKYD